MSAGSTNPGAIIAKVEDALFDTEAKAGDAAHAIEISSSALGNTDFVGANVKKTDDEGIFEKKKSGTGGNEEGRELNQEDIEAVEFLASEFSKEIQSTRAGDQKGTEIETIDSSMLDVAAVQGVGNEVEGGEQAVLVNLEAEFQTSQDIESDELSETSAKRKRTRAEEREFKCGFCAKSFSMRIALEKHLVVHGAKLPWQCPDCAKGFMKSSDYKDHCNKVHDNYRPFPCQVCGKALSNLGILKNHQGLHSGERPFQCSYPGCSKAFLTKTNLEDHHRKHVNAREFECETCHKRFNLKGDLRQHEKVHRQEKPFECEFCKMTFPRGPSLWRHRRTHTGEKPYACDICGKSFARMENCQEHRRIHTGERPLVCSVCGKAFRDSGNFSNHKKIHQDGYVPRKKRALTQKKPKDLAQEPQDATSATEDEAASTSVEDPTSADISSQEVAFIVAPMQIDDASAAISLAGAESSAEPSYVQVGNFLLTMEMEAAFKQLMQQHAGNNEYVTLAMTDGKGLELVSDPSQFGAIVQAATLHAQQGAIDIKQDAEKVEEGAVEASSVVESQTHDLAIEAESATAAEHIEQVSLGEDATHSKEDDIINPT